MTPILSNLRVMVGDVILNILEYFIFISAWIENAMKFRGKCSEKFNNAIIIVSWHFLV